MTITREIERLARAFAKTHGSPPTRIYLDEFRLLGLHRENPYAQSTFLGAAVIKVAEVDHLHVC